MFTFMNQEIESIAKNNDMAQFLRDMESAGIITEYDKQFIGYYSLQHPYRKNFTEVQRFDYLQKLNESLKIRASLPVYSFIEQ